MGKGRFVKRLNRFVILCLIGSKQVRAHLPNPGRLRELLLPGRTVYLAENRGGKSTDFTAVAVEREEAPVLLHTHLTNAVVGRLIEEGRLPGFEGARIVRTEAAFGRSRFDFLLERDGRPFVLEVKSCTLFGNSIAMFPDAVTVRGRRHIEELAALAVRGTAGGVVFLVHTPRVRYFLPDYHTDLTFARTFLNVKDKLLVRAFSVGWKRDLTLCSDVRELEIPWRLLDRELSDRGVYILVLHITEGRVLDVGGLGQVRFPQGFYLYAGSAKRNLRKRIERHLRRRKTLHWHIDYLRACADATEAIPIRSGDDLEHELATALGGIADWAIPSFGSSDCDCPTHLFGMKTNPIISPAFIDLLQHFRIDRLERMIAEEKT